MGFPGVSEYGSATLASLIPTLRRRKAQALPPPCRHVQHGAGPGTVRAPRIQLPPLLIDMAGCLQWVRVMIHIKSTLPGPGALQWILSGRGQEEFHLWRRLTGESGSSSRQRALTPPPPEIAEEDECPICHHELPSRELQNFEARRESHVTNCIRSHSTYSSPRTFVDSTAAPPPRRTGMYTYPATEKDCIDDAECTICLEEFTVGVPMARLECLCRFHRACISVWFVDHPGRCPVHQHDGFGY